MNESPDVNTKTALLLAAMEVFADKGFDSATVRDICGLAKANVAAVNYHYGSKDGLYTAVLEEIFPKGEEWISGDDTGLPPEERLHRFIQGLAEEIYIRSTGQIGHKWSIFLREMAKPSHNLDLIIRHQVQPRANELRDILTDLLGPDVPERTLAHCSSNIWALMLDPLLTRPIMNRLTPPRPSHGFDVTDFVDHVFRFALGGINGVKQSA